MITTVENRGRPKGSITKPKCQQCNSSLKYNSILKIMYCPKYYCPKFPDWARDSMSN